MVLFKRGLSMKKLLLILFLLFAHPVFAATYYLDPAGNDSSDGSVGHPWLTFQKASNTVAAGDTVCANDGTYLTPSGFTHFGTPGTESNPITFRNCQGGTVVIDLATQHSSTWTSLGGNLWLSNTVTIGMQSDVFRDNTWMGFIKSSCASVLIENDWCQGAGGKLEVYSATDPAGSTYRVIGSNIKLRNTAYLVFDGINAKWAGFAFEVGDTSETNAGVTNNITIKNAELAYCEGRCIRSIGSNAYPTHDLFYDRLNVHGCHDSSVDKQNGHCLKFDSNETGYQNYNVYVTNSTIYDCARHGIQFSDGWHDGNFSNNTIHDISQYQEGFGAGIRCGDIYNCYIHDNDIYGGSNPLGTGIYLQELTNPTQIYRNKIHGFNFNAISIFKSVKSPSGWAIYNNLIYDNHSSAISVYDSDSGGILNNTFYNNDGYQINIVQNRSFNIDIEDNIIYSSSTDIALSYYDTSFVTEGHNLYYNTGSNVIVYSGTPYNLANYKSASSQGTGSIFGNPLFVDPTLDLSLQPASPAIDSGTTLAQYFTSDYNVDFRPQGSGWDIGAYEYPFSGYGLKSGARILDGVKFK